MTYDPRPNASGDTLVASRDPIRTNFEILQSRFQDNHTDFGSGTGKHKFVEMPDQASIPAGLDPSEGTLYVKVSNGTSQLFYSNENSGNEYQMTRTNVADFPRFGVNAIAYVAGFDGGWTFLPGGMLLQYGSSQGNVADNGVIPFPKQFTTGAFSILVTPFTNVPSERTFKVFGNTTTQFQVRVNGGSTPLFWMAIGF